MTEIIAAIIGVALGFLLNELVNYFRKRGEQQQQSKAIKTLIKIEIGQNLNWLSQVRQRLDKAHEEARGPQEIDLPNFLARMSMPVWSHRLWESQLPNVALVLSPETIRQVHEFHGDLDKILEIILAMNDNPNQVSYRKELYDQCVELINKLIQRGNPIN